MIDPVSAALDAAGLIGWRGIVRAHPESQDRVAVLHSPDYDPVRKLGQLVIARGPDADQALAKATADAARGIA